MSRAEYESVGEPAPTGTPVTITSDVPQPEEPPSMEKDFYHRPMQTLRELGMPLKIHLGIGVAVSSLCFLIWHFTTASHTDPSTSLWWWIFPAFSFAITISLHHNFAQQKYMEGAITAVIIANVFLFFAYKVTTPPNGFPWWIYPPLVSAMIMVPIYYRSRQDPVYSNLFSMLWLEYWILNLLFFLTWAALPLHHPWFFYPLIALGTPMLLYRAKNYYRETRIPVLVGIPIAALNLIFFIVWGFADIMWPWFIIPLAITGGVELLLIWRFRAHTHQVISDEPAYPAAGAPGEGNYQYPVAGGEGQSPAPYNAAVPAYSQPSYAQ